MISETARKDRQTKFARRAKRFFVQMEQQFRHPRQNRADFVRELVHRVFSAAHATVPRPAGRARREQGFRHFILKPKKEKANEP
jgi:hypothetical protein